MRIGIAGAARHGKDTIGEVLRDEYGFTIKKFAEPLYEILDAVHCTGHGRSDLVALGNTVRRLDPEFLVRAAKRAVVDADDVVFTDVRDVYEMRWIRRRGTLFFVERPDFDAGITDIDGLDQFLPHAKRCASHRFRNAWSPEALREFVRSAMNVTSAVRQDCYGKWHRVWRDGSWGCWCWRPTARYDYGY